MQSLSVIVSFVFALATFPTPSFAPFPDDHPYHFLNPWLDPWWETLDAADRKTIYGYWKVIEPTAIAIADVVDGKRHINDAVLELAEAKKAYFKSWFDKDEDKRDPLFQQALNAKAHVSYWKHRTFDSKTKAVKLKYNVLKKDFGKLKEAKKYFIHNNEVLPTWDLYH